MEFLCQREMLLALLQAFGRPPTDEAAVIAELTRRFSRALKQQIVVESVRVTLLDRTALGAEVVRAELPLMQAEVQRAVAEGVRGLSTSEATCATRPDAGGCAPSLREMLDGAVGKVLSDAAPSVVAAPPPPRTRRHRRDPRRPSRSLRRGRHPTRAAVFCLLNCSGSCWPP